MLKLYNSLTRKVEEFKPVSPPKVGMYTCGPTVYDHMHIGNLRTFLLSDILYRTLKLNGYEVLAVQNITDIDDKIIKRAKEKNLTIQQLSDEYTKYFLQDINKLNIEAGLGHQPKATEHIGQMIKYIEELIKKDLAYEEKDGSVYFDISKFKGYGKLSGLESRTLKTGTRVLSDEYSKDDVQDFALWKSVKSDETGWDSPWGKGRPGWHIECSVMSKEYLGETFDLHIGGVDLIFPHHENEIAQSEGKTGKKFVNYFVHGEHLLVDNKKMSKSAGNYVTLREVEEKSFDPLAFRYLILTAHYKDKLNFTWESLSGAQKTLDNIREKIRGLKESNGLSEQANLNTDPIWQEFVSAANNNLNMPQAVAVLHKLLSLEDTTSRKSRLILEMDKILGLGLDKYLGKGITEYTLQKSGWKAISYTRFPLSGSTIVGLDKREIARRQGDFTQSDEIRKELEEKDNITIQDTSAGTAVKDKG